MIRYRLRRRRSSNFFREAGDRRFPTLSLIDGFSSSSHVSQSEPAGSWVLIDFNVGY